MFQSASDMEGFCENGSEPSGSIEKAGYFLTGWVTISFSNNVLHHGVSKYISHYMYFLKVIW
jgi:hypothetical protein